MHSNRSFGGGKVCLAALLCVVSLYVAMELIPSSRRLLPILTNEPRLPGSNAESRVLIHTGTKVTMSRHYAKCGHVETEVLAAPTGQMIGLDAAGLRRVYPEWQVVEFGDRNLSLVKSEPGMCADDSRYRTVTSLDGRVVIYYGSGKLPNPIMYRDTAILVSALSRTDRDLLEKGVVLNSEQEAADWLEGLTE